MIKNDFFQNSLKHIKSNNYITNSIKCKFNFNKTLKNFSFIQNKKLFETNTNSNINLNFKLNLSLLNFKSNKAFCSKIECSNKSDQLVEEKDKDKENKHRTIYLDFQSTTPLDPEVLNAMLPYMVQKFGNPHSKTHAYGWEAENGVETARAQIARLINADPKEIIFTSGATESNNLALKGVAEFYKDKKKHLICTQIDHKCVLDTMRYLEGKGFRVTYLPVKTNGLVDLEELKNAITEDTLAFSCIMVHNEIGVIQDIKEIGKICRERKVYFHTDAAQGVGKIPVDVNEMNIDMLSISGHKLYGPKGVGALYIRRKPRVRLVPQMNGGGQERGFRSGTLSPFVSSIILTY
jgi:cysteine desulfurase